MDKHRLEDPEFQVRCVIFSTKDSEFLNEEDSQKLSDLNYKYLLVNYDFNDNCRFIGYIEFFFPKRMNQLFKKFPRFNFYRRKKPVKIVVKDIKSLSYKNFSELGEISRQGKINPVD